MDACPVCETPRPPGALECPTCGRIFEKAAEAALAELRLPDLEPTMVADPGLLAPQETVPGLETTALELGAAVAAVEPVPDLEATAAAPVAVGVVERPADLEPTAQAPAEPKSQLGESRCRYCGNSGQPAGLFCDRCGMRLPRLREEPTAAAGAPVPEGVACRACGCRRFVEGRRADCGLGPQAG